MKQTVTLLLLLVGFGVSPALAQFKASLGVSRSDAPAADLAPLLSKLKLGNVSPAAPSQRSEASFDYRTLRLENP